MSTALTPLEKKRNSAFKSMTPEGQRLAIELQEKLARKRASDVVVLYAIGARAAAAHAEEATYGSNFVELLADYLDVGGGSRTLHALIRLSKAFKHEFIKAQSLRLMSSGGTLEIAHWMQLMRVDDSKQQLTLLEDTLANAWSSRQLDEEITARGVSVRKARGLVGHKLREPTSPLGGLQQLYKAAGAFCGLHDMLERAVFAKIDELSNSQVSEALLEKMQVAYDRTGEAQTAAAAASARLEEGIKRVRTLLGSPPAAPVPASDGEAPARRSLAKKKKGKKVKKVKKVKATAS